MTSTAVEHETLSTCLLYTSDAADADAAERLARHTRDGLNVDVVPDPEDLFAHVYAKPTPQLVEQLAQVKDELSREETS